MLGLDTVGWIVVALCAIMMGASKTGIPGIGILVVPLMAIVIKPADKSVGALLGILILADIFAIIYHRQNAKWGHIARLLPAAIAGIVAAYFGLRALENKELLKPIIGGIVLAMLALNYWRTRTKGKDVRIPTQWWFAWGLGFMAGITTMMANAAGPVMIIYLLAMRLDKMKFVGTAAWFFFIVNWLKVPFSSKLDMMTAESIKLDFMMLPFIAIGALAGIYLLKRIPQKAFKVVVQILAAAAALKLLFSWVGV
ncbi:MAG: sulfite exporter TauE/SafE family protein [Sedimentisphaerales bacterium]|nr:sulfite exporter TauE/SafE family protein [Sedimentisphaerales bacterium]